MENDDEPDVLRQQRKKTLGKKFLKKVSQNGILIVYVEIKEDDIWQMIEKLNLQGKF